MDFNNIKFILNNVRGIKNSEKRMKIFEFLKNKVDSNGMLFLQETKSCEKDKKKRGMVIFNEYYSLRMEQENLVELL